MDDDHFFDRAKVDRWPHFDVLEKIGPLLGLDDVPDGDSLRIDPVEARREDAISRFDVAESGYVVHLDHRLAVAADDALSPRSLDQSADRGVVVGHQLHLGQVVRGQDHPADQAFLKKMASAVKRMPFDFLSTFRLS